MLRLALDPDRAARRAGSGLITGLVGRIAVAGLAINQPLKRVHLFVVFRQVGLFGFPSLHDSNGGEKVMD